MIKTIVLNQAICEQVTRTYDP